MVEMNPSVAEQLAKAASDYQKRRSGHAPAAVTVVLSQDMLVITLAGALTPAEMRMASTPEGRAKVQEFHRLLFADSSAEFRQEIKRITGVEVRESVAEIESMTGTVVHAFTSGTAVHVYQLTTKVPPGTWSTRGDEIVA
jgi:uncharacterized protein YbcI